MLKIVNLILCVFYYRNKEKRRKMIKMVDFIYVYFIIIKI